MPTVTLYNTPSEKNAMQKQLTGALTVSGDFSDSIDIMRPVFIMETSAYINNYNYAYISDFGRYYWITENEAERTGITRITLKSDPLMSFRSGILRCPAIAERVSGGDAKLYNSYLPDAKIRLNASDFAGTHVIQSFGYGNQYFLVTAG